MRLLLVLPILVPLSTGILCVLVWRHARLQRMLAIAGTAVLLAASGALFAAVWRGGIAATQVGGWPAPFGITLVADHLAAAMVLFTSLIGLLGAIYSAGSMDERRQASGYYPLLNLMLTGLCGAYLTGDLFNLFVWFEVLLLSSFVLMALGGERGQLEGALKYVLLNMLGSVFFLIAVGLLYRLAGTLNMADLARKLPALGQPRLVSAVAMLFLAAFGIKAAIFPLFFWLPASYHRPPVAITAIFGGLLTKVGVYALVRTFTLLFVQDTGFTHRLILVLGAMTMITGVLGAVAQNDFRRLLAFHIISQIGYMLMGLGLLSPLALAATVFFMIHIIVTKTALFFVSGIVHQLQGTYDLTKLSGFYRGNPGVATLFLIPALSLGGIPPLSGFIGKLSLIQAGLALRQYTIVAVALGVSLLTLYSMIKIWTKAFWEPEAGEFNANESHPVLTRWESVSMVVPATVLTALAVGMGLFAGPCFEVAMRSGGELIAREPYIQAVLGVR